MQRRIAIFISVLAASAGVWMLRPSEPRPVATAIPVTPLPAAVAAQLNDDSLAADASLWSSLADELASLGLAELQFEQYTADAREPESGFMPLHAAMVFGPSAASTLDAWVRDGDTIVLFGTTDEGDDVVITWNAEPDED